MRHFYNTADYSIEELDYLIKLAGELKHGKKLDLGGKIINLLFFNPSLRTRISFMAGMNKLKGAAFDVPLGQAGAYNMEFKEAGMMDKSAIEHVREAAGVLSRYGEAIGVRSSDLVTNKENTSGKVSWEELKKDTVIKSFMQFSQVPVINMESNVYHPCQGLGDALTIREKLGITQRKKYAHIWSYHPKALPTATSNSQILSACDLGMEVSVAYPEGWDLDREIVSEMKKRANEAGGSLEFSHDQQKAYHQADIVCVKSWGALSLYGNWEKEKREREKYKDWMATEEKMGKTEQAFFMHCLPVRRNVEVADAVLDGASSIVLDQAENRMWIQMAILYFLLQKGGQL